MAQAGGGTAAGAGGRVALAVALAVAAVALAVRLSGLAVRPVWLDEMYTLFALSRGWGDLVAERMAQGHSPVWFLLMKALPLPPGEVVPVRALAAACDSVAAGGLAWVMARHAGWVAGLAGGLLIAGSATHVEWALNARPYGALMLALAVGIAGAVELLRARGGPVPRWAAPAHALGFTAAAVTMTGGIIAFAAVALAPFAVGALRRDAGFRARWLRASALPVVACLAMAVAVSLPHAAEEAGTYWSERYNPFGRASLERLALALAMGEPSVPPDPRAPGGALYAVGVAQALALAGLAGWGLWRLRGSAPGVVLGGLALGAGGVLLLVSLHTSVLVPRYFLPAWSAVLLLAGAALGTGGWPGLRLVAAGATVGLALVLAGVQAGSRAWPVPGGVADAAARIVHLARVSGAEAATEPGLRNPVLTEVMAAILDDPDHPRPVVRAADPPQAAALVAEAQAAGRTLVLVLTPAVWARDGGAVLPRPDCVEAARDLIVLVWTDGACPG